MARCTHGHEAHCWFAEGSIEECRCECGGANHGLALRKKANSYEEAEKHSNAQLIKENKEGNQEAEQELYPPAVKAVKIYFKTHFRRDPTPEDYLYYTIPAFADDEIRSLPYHCLWCRVRKVGERSRAEGIIKREIQISPHLFRRTYATLLYRQGMKIRAI